MANTLTGDGGACDEFPHLSGRACVAAGVRLGLPGPGNFTAITSYGKTQTTSGDHLFEFPGVS